MKNKVVDITPKIRKKIQYDKLKLKYNITDDDDIQYIKETLFQEFFSSIDIRTTSMYIYTKNESCVNLKIEEFFKDVLEDMVNDAIRLLMKTKSKKNNILEYVSSRIKINYGGLIEELLKIYAGII